MISQLVTVRFASGRYPAPLAPAPELARGPNNAARV
jgi:hypothetical protein